MLICVMRHGDAEAPSSRGNDAARKLTAVGHAENKRIAEQLKKQQPDFQRLWVSPYTRAQQTAIDVLRCFPNLQCERLDSLVPEADPRFLLEQLSALSEESVLLVGHNPLVSRFAALLTEGGPTIDRYLGTSHLVAIQTEVVAPACGAIKYYLTP